MFNRWYLVSMEQHTSVFSYLKKIIYPNMRCSCFSAPSKISWGGNFCTKTRRGISSTLCEKRKDVNVKYFLRNHFFLITTVVIIIIIVFIHVTHTLHTKYIFWGADSFPVHPLLEKRKIYYLQRMCEGILCDFLSCRSKQFFFSSSTCNQTRLI